MPITLVHVHVKEAHIEDFIAACRENHEGSIQENGNIRFDVIQSVDDPSRFVLYEWFDSESDVNKHKETAHYLKWRDTVADWMVEPRQGVKYAPVFPQR